MKIKIGVLFGGKSVEHEISIISAVQAMNYIDDEKYEVVPIYITKKLEFWTGAMLKDIESYKDFKLIQKFAKKVHLVNKRGRFVLQKASFIKREINDIDLAFPIVHGEGVEDGTIQGYFELLGIPYIGSNIYASAVGQDKVFQKQIFEANDIPITKYVWFFENEYYDEKENLFKKINKLNYPLIIKPSKLGSSIGISIVKNKDDLNKAIEEAVQYDNKIIVEEALENLTEVNCAVLGNYEKMITSEIEEVLKEDEILSYNDKYIGSSKGASSKGMASTRRILPARINDETKNTILELSKKVFKVLNNSGVARIDYLIDNKKNKIYVNEINSIPGSLSYYLFEPIQISYPELLESLITTAIKEYKKKSKMTVSFETNILKNYSSNGLKGIKK